MYLYGNIHIMYFIFDLKLNHTMNIVIFVYLNDLFYLYECLPACIYVYYMHVVPVDVRKCYQTPELEL